jgi:plastocyanin
MNRYLIALALTTLLLYSCSSPPGKPKTYTVEIKDMKFVPDDIVINKGDTVLWINRDMMKHDVTEEKTKAWTSSPIAPGASWKMAINSDAKYYCSIHVVMKGSISIE